MKNTITLCVESSPIQEAMSHRRREDALSTIFAISHTGLKPHKFSGDRTHGKQEGRTQRADTMIMIGVYNYTKCLLSLQAQQLS